MSVLAVPFYVFGKALSALLGIKESMATQFTVSMINAILTAFSCVMVYHFALERLNFCSSTDCFRPDNNQGGNYMRFADLFGSAYEKGGFGG